MKGNLLVLFEHSTGYALFKIIANEEIGALLPQVQESVGQLDRFGKVVKLHSFIPFGTAQASLENALAVADGMMHSNLEEFLMANLGNNKEKVRLGCSDIKLATSIQEKIRVKCECNETILEITRGIRQHFSKMVEQLSEKISLTAQTALGHSFSRSRVKFNVKKADNMIIQASALNEQLDKDINTFSMRIREWYSLHFPELYPLLNNNILFSKASIVIGDRNLIDDNVFAELSDLLQDEELCQKIVEAAKISIGSDISELDLINIRRFASKVVSLSDFKAQMQEYLRTKMNDIAPNLTAIVGENIGGKLISQAGSLVNLAKCPASTLQILGAEKALFRAIRTRGKTPKYGIIYHSGFISRAKADCKGRVSRLLAHKCSIASRIDYFQETPNCVIGNRLKDQLEERLQFANNPTDELPTSNELVMKDALEKLKQTIESTSADNGAKRSRKRKVKTERNSDMSFKTKDDEKSFEQSSMKTGIKESHKKKAKKPLNNDDQTVFSKNNSFEISENLGTVDDKLTVSMDSTSEVTSSLNKKKKRRNKKKKNSTNQAIGDENMVGVNE